MRIQCPHCGTGGNIPDEKVPATGRNVTCPKCKASFFVQKQVPQTSQAKTGPEDAVVRYKEGVKLLKERHIDAAIEKFNLAIQANPQYGEAYRSLGLAYGQKNLWAEASQVLEKALTSQPDDLQALKNLGVAYLQQKKFADAERMLQKALHYAPDDEKVKSYLAVALRSRNQPEAFPGAQPSSPPVETRAETLSATMASPPQAKSVPQRNPIRELLDQGVDYLDNAQYNSAIEAFNEVIRLAPHKSDGYFGLGMVYEKQAEWEKAIEVYQKAFELNPNDKTIKENLTFAQKQQKKTSRWKLWKK